MTFQNKKILVAGLGGTGISMIAYLRKNGAEVAAYDAELKPERVSQIGKMFDRLVFYTGRLKDALDKVSIFWRSVPASASGSRILRRSSKTAGVCWATLNCWRTL